MWPILENGFAGASTLIDCGKHNQRTKFFFFSLLLFCFADFVFTLLQFVRIPQNSASKLMAPKFSSHRRRRRRGSGLGASRVESVIHTRRQGVECSAEYRICPITVIRHCHSRHWTLPGALSGREMGEGGFY